MQESEKRSYTRVAVDAYISATLTTDKTQMEKIFTTRDIGPEGIFLVSGETFPIGTVVNLKIHTPSTVKPINVEARVIRIARNENSQVTGMGLIFLPMSEEEKKELFKHLYLAYHYVETDKKQANIS
jgi:c-di-GMP-binding flagellar brake protein YcgR